MPFKNPEQRREYMRQYMAQYRGGGHKPGKTRCLPAAVCIRTAGDCLSLLEGQVVDLLHDHDLKTTERARAVGYLTGLCLKAVEVADLESRLAKLEADAEDVQHAANLGTR
jgi:hypothetical protein